MAFVVSEGSLRAIEKPTVQAPYSMRLADRIDRDYGALWRAQPELRTVVDFLARNIAQLGLHVFRRVTDVDRERLADHPLAGLIGKPNPSTTRYRLINSLVHDICIYDSGYWLKVREGGDVLALRRIRPQRITPAGDDWLEAQAYTITGTKGSLTVPASEVIHFRGYNPDDDRTGSSAIESLRTLLSEEFEANRYREQLWRNGARMAGYLRRPVDAPEWSAKGKERFRDQWQSQYSGDGPSAGGTPILEDGMEFVPASTSPRDAQYVESRKLTREEVARSYHVPLPMVGILDHATFSNIREQHKQLYQDCLGPWLEMIQQEIELQLLPDLPDTAGVYVEFNIHEKLRGSFEEQAAQLQQSVGAPYMTRNEARARLNLPQVDGGDELVVPLNMAVGAAVPVTPPADQQQETDVAPKAVSVSVKARAPQRHTNKATETLARYFARQGQVVASALGAAKRGGPHVKAAVDDVLDRERWDKELAADLLRVNTGMASEAFKLALTALGADPADYDEAVMYGWLTANASGTATVINDVTAANLADALKDDDPLAAVRHLFEGYAAVRAAQVATSLTSSMSGFGSVEAGRHAGGDGATKTWVTGHNPRPSHARMNGETVPVDAKFSNGARWPADHRLGVDDIAGCNCDVVITAA